MGMSRINVSWTCAACSIQQIASYAPPAFVFCFPTALDSLTVMTWRE